MPYILAVPHSGGTAFSFLLYIFKILTYIICIFTEFSLILWCIFAKTMKVLIADAGATKTDWIKAVCDDSSDRRTETYTGVGISPLHHDSDMITDELRLVRAALGDSFDRIRFYGTGIGSPMLAGKMEALLSDIFKSQDIKADGDMAGAAIAVLGNSPGIACIMGTGSNSCHYDGNAIDRESTSVGYLLDDEGGGVSYGRRLLSDIYKKIAPEDIIRKFDEKYSLTVSDVLENLYRKPAPNKWIASFMPFIIENASNPYIISLVEKQTERFLDREFYTFPEKELKEEGIGFVGSVAYLFSDTLKMLMDKKGWRLRDIVRRPLDAIVRNQI